jgi:GT2 family glycosyltransferase/glycosyltransferase involved in cell wall biosynthesis
MTTDTSVVIPVKNGARWLPETLEALRRDKPREILVIDSGSSDRSAPVARECGARVLQIRPEEFGHGRTRNLGVAVTDGSLVCFLSQDALPRPGWLRAFDAVMSGHPAVGAAFGPQLPRPDTSPLVARELRDFFASFGAPDEPRIWPRGEAPYLSNVNACYRRACLEDLGGFPEVDYAEDQAFSMLLAASSWQLAYEPRAAVAHAHEYRRLAFMRRSFDDYRGLHAARGHAEEFGVRSFRIVRDQTIADISWMREEGRPKAALVAGGARSLIRNSARHVAAVAGAHAGALPPRARRAISLDRSDTGRPSEVPIRGTLPWDSVAEVARSGASPLLAPVPGMADAEKLHIAVAIPAFGRGSGGHSTICNLVTRLEERGHTITTWLHDPHGHMKSTSSARLRDQLREFFRPVRGPVFSGFDEWFGCDVAVATSWDTVHPVLRLDHCRARAYLVQDHEPEFFATSAESLWAQQTYRHDLHLIAASRWLAERAGARAGRPAAVFDLGVDHTIYRPLKLPRRNDTVIFYARDVTPRRGAPLGLLALAELHRRRPAVRIVLYGTEHRLAAPFAHHHLGLASHPELARAYCEATVGLSISLTNHSLIPQEMLACGLPCVEIAGRSLEGVYGEDGPLLLVEPEAIAIADALERLLDHPDERETRARRGIEAVSKRSWERASIQLEDGLRRALRERSSRDATGGGPLSHV